jgi:hypothetical protein
VEVTIAIARALYDDWLSPRPLYFVIRPRSEIRTVLDQWARSVPLPPNPYFPVPILVDPALKFQTDLSNYLTACARMWQRGLLEGTPSHAPWELLLLPSCQNQWHRSSSLLIAACLGTTSIGPQAGREWT